MARPPEYIGISGVVSIDQQLQLEAQFGRTDLARSRQLQLGVKATHKPQYLDTENRYGKEWYPVGDGIERALEFSSNTMGVAQVFFDEEQLHNMSYRDVFMKKLLGRTAHSWLTGLQFDRLGDWCADPQIAYDVINKIPNGLTTILQCQAELLEQYIPQEVADALVALPRVDYVLFDASGGRGVPMDSEQLLPFIEQVYGDIRLGATNVAVGGGLDAEVVAAKLPILLKKFPQLSWDAEGKLHPLKDSGMRPLDMEYCREYIEASAAVVRYDNGSYEG